MVEFLVIYHFGFFLSVLSESKKRTRDMWLEKLNDIDIEQLCLEPPKKKFKPKHHLPVLADYSKPAPAWYWQQFPANYSKPAKSLIDGEKMKEMALEYGYSNYEQLDKVTKWLKEGADIGCHPLFRKPSRVKNSESCYKDGEKISDALADWITKGSFL